MVIFLQDIRRDFRRDEAQFGNFLGEAPEILFRKILVNRAGRFIPQDNQENSRLAHSGQRFSFVLHYVPGVLCRTQL